MAVVKLPPIYKMKLRVNKRKSLKCGLVVLLISSIAAISISGYNIIRYKIDRDNLKENQQIILELVKEEKDEGLTVDFNKLKEQNDEVVGFLKVNGTNIDCPIVKAYDNSFYLNHGFDKKYNILGWPFVDYRNKIDGEDKNIIMYGHNLNDGTFFGSLINVLSSDWQSKEENQTIMFVTEKGTKTYQVFSTYEFKPEKYYITTEFESDEAYTRFLNTIKTRSNHDYGIETSQNDKILTLSSCIGTGQARVVLHAKEINNY